MLSNEAILKIIDWAKESADNFAKVEVSGDSIYVFVFKYSLSNGTNIKEDYQCEDINKAIEDKMKRDRKAEYEKLKAEFEGDSNA